MKMFSFLKHLGPALCAATLLAGCAGAPQVEAPMAEEAPDRVAQEAAAAIAAAKAAVAKANSVDGAWRDSGKFIKDAEAAAKAGDYDKALALANKARREGDLGYAQAMDERRRWDERMARERAQAMAKQSRYQVLRGDSLWRIAEQPQIYADPYQWPLIYKANQGQIRDADLIYPGQVFAIDRAASSADVSAAVRHARTRGAWSLGVVEASDRAYLGR